MSSAKLSSPFSVTVTLSNNVHKELLIYPGDSIFFEVAEDGSVELKKISPQDKDYIALLTHSLAEWDSTEDDEAFEYLQDV